MSIVEIPAPGPDREWLSTQMMEAARIQAERVEELNSPVITLHDAMCLARISSGSAWDRWCKKWKVKNCGYGRYPRLAVMNALKIEAGERGDYARERRLAGRE
jgi:hypothetical protein